MPFHARAMHPAMIIGTVRSYCGRGYGADTTIHSNVFLVSNRFMFTSDWRRIK